MIRDFRFPVSTLSDIILEKEKWMNFEVSGTTWKKKQQNITVSITRNASS